MTKSWGFLANIRKLFGADFRLSRPPPGVDVTTLRCEFIGWSQPRSEESQGWPTCGCRAGLACTAAVRLKKTTHRQRGLPRDRAGEVCQPDSLSLLEWCRSGIGHAGRYSIGIRGKRADIWSPHTVCNAWMALGRGVPCRDVAASSHGLRCEYGSRDQRRRHEGQFGHLFLPHGDRSQGSARLLVVKSGRAWKIFHHALSTKRDLLRTLRGTLNTAHAAASRLSNGTGRQCHRYPPQSRRYRSGAALP